MKEKNIATSIRGLLNQTDMTIEEFSEFVDLPTETIRSMIYGKTRDCKLQNALKISNAFSLTVNEIFS